MYNDFDKSLLDDETIKQYINAGFNIYKPTTLTDNSVFLLGKSIYNEDRIKFHCFISVYDFRKYNFPKSGMKSVGLDPHVQFDLKTGETVNIALLTIESPEQVIAFFEKTFDTLNAKCYE